jgi:universal stress protein E
MSARDRILVVVEPENTPKAIVKRATWVAKLMDCELDLLLCDTSVSVLGDGFFVSNEAREIGLKIRQAQEEMIEELAEDAREDGVTVTTDVLVERPVADAVLARALDTNPRFVMKGTHYHSIAERAIMVDTDWQLIRTCPYPLWLVKAGDFQEEPFIVAAVDPTHEHDKPAVLDKAIVEAARSVSGPAGGDLHLLHTYQRLIGIGSEANKTFKAIKLPINEIDERMQKEHRDALDAFAEQYGFDKKHVHQLPGRTREILPTFARAHNADLVVMGALARWGIKRMVIGSTTERVLDHLPCDVLIVRCDKRGAAASFGDADEVEEEGVDQRRLA